MYLYLSTAFLAICIYLSVFNSYRSILSFYQVHQWNVLSIVGTLLFLIKIDWFLLECLRVFWWPGCTPFLLPPPLNLRFSY